MQERVVYVNKIAFVWDDEAGLEPEAVLQLKRFAFKLAKRYERWGAYNGCALEDLAQAALLGALEAAPRYDATRGCSFISYAFHYMKMEIMRLVDSDLVSGKVCMVFEEGNMDNEQFEMKYGLYDHSVAQSDMERSEISRKIEEALRSLDQRSRCILLGRAVHERSLEEIAVDFGVSRERIRQLEGRALQEVYRKLRRSGVVFGPMMPVFVNAVDITSGKRRQEGQASSGTRKMWGRGPRKCKTKETA